jgi:hypothetical protein
MTSLQWAPEPPYHVARVPGGHYSIERVDSRVTYFELKGLIWPARKFGTIADAKAFAQSDFDARTPIPPTRSQEPTK